MDKKPLVKEDVVGEVEKVEEKVLTIAELEAKLVAAAKAVDLKVVREVSRQLESAEKAKAEVERKAVMKVIDDLTKKVKGLLDKVVEVLKEKGELDKVDGVWYAADFGNASTSCRLLKSTPRAKSEGKGQGSYISRPEKTTDLLNLVGGAVMFEKDTVVTIDKVEVVMKTGTTFKAAHDYSTNGGWRNSVRMALLKEAKLI